MSLSAGKLRHRLRIERYADDTDSAGDPIQDPNTGAISRSWQFVADVWGALEPLSAREFIASQAVQSRVSARVTIRYRDDVYETCRIVHRGQFYNIEGVLADKDSGLEYMTLPVSEGVSDGQ